MPFTKIQVRRGTAAEWVAANTVLGAGEFGFETDSKRIKVGDGTAAWADLAYLSPGPNSVVASSGISSLTSGQQSSIVVGSLVTTSDGRRWIYSGSGSKTSEASYVELADVTPVWSAIANTPTTIAGYGITDAVSSSDARLTDARAPTSHSHGDITNSGAIGSTSGQIVVTTTSGVLTTATIGSGLTLSGGTLTSSGGGGGSGEDTGLRALFVPPAPAAPTGVAGNAQVVLSWTAPTVLAQTPITDYVVQFSTNAGSTWTTFSDGTSTATSATITGLTNETAHVFRVAGVNGAGQGAWSSASVSLTPTAGVPLTFLLVGGGGGGGNNWAAGGGAGGYRSITGVNAVIGTQYTVTVGAGGGGGASGNANGSSGGTTSFFSLSAAGGGGGGGAFGVGAAGGSGGGTGYVQTATTLAGGAGNTPATSPPQGNDGGAGFDSNSGGGGGAGAAGGNAVAGQAGAGGAGAASSITGSSVTRAGGGGGGGQTQGNQSLPGSGGAGGGGAGAGFAAPGGNGTASTGGGGGGGGASNGNGGAGGGGVVIIRAPQAAASTSGSPTITTVGGDTVYTFTGSGSITF